MKIILSNTKRYVLSFIYAALFSYNLTAIPKDVAQQYIDSLSPGLTLSEEMIHMVMKTPDSEWYKFRLLAKASITNDMYPDEIEVLLKCITYHACNGLLHPKFPGYFQALTRREMLPTCRVMIIDALGKVPPKKWKHFYKTVNLYLPHSRGTLSRADVIAGFGNVSPDLWDDFKTKIDKLNTYARCATDSDEYASNIFSLSALAPLHWDAFISLSEEFINDKISPEEITYLIAILSDIDETRLFHPQFRVLAKSLITRDMDSFSGTSIIRVLGEIEPNHWDNFKNLLSMVSFGNKYDAEIIITLGNISENLKFQAYSAIQVFIGKYGIKFDDPDYLISFINILSKFESIEDVEHFISDITRLFERIKTDNYDGEPIERTVAHQVLKLNESASLEIGDRDAAIFQAFILNHLGRLVKSGSHYHKELMTFRQALEFAHEQNVDLPLPRKFKLSSIPLRNEDE